ncbi:AfsR/SARP family transcriptional regulator [Streptomyces sp. VRA16 Mangrove soil]|uniref:AfsR/SARP family transcriptional regulator n=1 Tax=Streptomyces sp. VRA16 Mangrove soil TaxID=2817434 RepID=UPI001A9F0794|nr:AfsR/SARP family transcriptional regulator [Streptomyces sp. VRA16 Mangrove soil]MBO1333555.1 winged helix-turn-helix domain-containing protein [Streptomyces sp. VRA16 Mangrove soil]
MEFQLLGPVAVNGGSGPVPLGPAKRRSLLAILLLRSPAAVSVDTLTTALWDDEPPLHARTVIQGHVSRLRALITEAGLDAYGVELTTQGQAYALQLPETLLDAHRFDELVTLAQQQRDPADTALMLREALALWQGPALGGTAVTAPLLAAANALEESRLGTVEQLALAYGALGEHDRAVALLSGEAVAHALREPLIAELIRALFHAGRQSDALDQYHRTRRALADELGVDPGPALRKAYEEVLEGRPPVTSAPGPHPTSGAATPAPRDATIAPGAPGLLPRPSAAGPDLLPRPPRGFHGQHAELAALTRAVTAAESPIALVTGPAGVGKTSLAVHWAHDRADDFPDGRLFADLRGHSGPAPEDAVQPADVLREFLLALGVEAPAVPASSDAAAALFRSLVRKRRLLVVLDNARDSAQVRPLLPGGAGCATVVTSRTRLDGVMASDWATPVPVDVLGEDDAAGLLTAALGPDATDDDAVREVARLCDGLPLALRIAAARLKGRRHWTVADLATELADEEGRLTLLSAEDTGIEAALRASVARLTAADTGLLGALGRSFTRESDAYAAAAAAGIPLAEARAGLDRLAAAHLVQETTPGRYGLHDLVRLYARGLPRDETPDAVTRRLVDHWLRAQHVAVDVFDPTGARTVALPDGFDTAPPVPRFAERDAVFGWFLQEQESLMAAVSAAARLGDEDRTWRIATLLWPLVHWHPHPGWQQPLRTALAAAERIGSTQGIGWLRAVTGLLFVETGQFARAETFLAGAVAPLRTFAPEVSAQVLVLLAIARQRHGDPAGMLDALADAAHDARTARHPIADTLDHYHATHVALARADFVTGATRMSRCLAAIPENEIAGWRPLIWESYGVALHHSGLHQEAREALLAAVAANEEEDLPARTVRTLTRLGDVAAVLDEPDSEAAYRARAEQLQQSLTHP